MQLLPTKKHHERYSIQNAVNIAVIQMWSKSLINSVNFKLCKAHNSTGDWNVAHVFLNVFDKAVIFTESDSASLFELTDYKTL